MQKTALVIDDSKSVRFALGRLLESLGYIPAYADCADAGYKALSQQLPEVIFLDHIMPGVDGFAALKSIKSNPRTASVPVIICSSNDSADYIASANARGASTVLHKPPSAESIAASLSGLVSRSPSYIDPTPEPITATKSPVTSNPQREPTVMERLMSTIPPKMIPTAGQLHPAAPSNETQPVSSTPKTAPATKNSTAKPQQTETETKTSNTRNLERRQLNGSSALGSVDSPDSANALRRDFDARLSDLTEQLRLELALIHNATAGSSTEEVQNIAREAALQATTELAEKLDTYMDSVRLHIDAVIAAQNQRIDQLADQLRGIAAAEAERVTNAAIERLGNLLVSTSGSTR